VRLSVSLPVSLPTTSGDRERGGRDRQGRAAAYALAANAAAIKRAVKETAVMRPASRVVEWLSFDATKPERTADSRRYPWPHTGRTSRKTTSCFDESQKIKPQTITHIREYRQARESACTGFGSRGSRVRIPPSRPGEDGKVVPGFA
jgi:hypothetical protein